MSINFFKLIGQRLAYGQQHYKTVSQNLAHLNTPNYKTLEIENFHFQTHKDFELRRTHPSHLDVCYPQEKFKVRKNTKLQENFSGNNVSLNAELLKANQIGAEHLQMHNLYQAHTKILSMALDK